MKEIRAEWSWMFTICTPHQMLFRCSNKKTTAWVGHGARLGDGGVACKIVVGRPEEKMSLGRPRSRWEDKVAIDLQEVGYGGTDWIALAQDRVR
jgi:hypothetical protein